MELFLGFYCGVLFMVIIYNFYWYGITKEKSYLYYALLRGGLILNVLQNIQIIESSTFFVMLNVTMIFVLVLLFAKAFLELKENFKIINQIMNYMIVFVVLLFLYSVVIGEYSVYEQPYSLIILPFVIIGYFVYKNGFEPAKYYVLGWGISIVLTGIDDFKSYDIITLNADIPFTLIGHIIESLILSYAIFIKTNLIVKEKEEQSKILIHQAKLASMGQMLENISHQWRQPLNRISTFIINMQVYLESSYKDEKYLPKMLIHTQEQLEYMSNTITDFTNFNKQIQDKEHFLASSVFDLLVKITGQSLEKNNIDFKLEIEEDFSMYSYPNELAQVLLNLIQNAQDAIVEREIKEPVIRVIIHKNSIEVEDNAGGIEAKVIQQMFEPYFSTKSKSTSMGLGLYMSKIILKQYFRAKIELSQSKKKITFKILFS